MQNLNDNEYSHLTSSILEEFGYVIDFETYELLYMNKIALDSYNLKEDEYKGNKCYKIICQLDEPCSHCKNHLLKENEFLKRYHHTKFNNSHLALKERIEIINGRRCVVITGIDISNADSKKKELKFLSTVDEGIIKCADTLLKETGQSMYELLQILADFYKGERAYILDLNYKTMTINCLADFTQVDSTKKAKTLKNIPFSFESELGQLLSNNDYIYVDSIDKMFTKGTPDYDMITKDGTTNFLSIPLSKNGKLVGFIVLEELLDYNNDPSLLVAVAAFVVNNMYKNKALKQLRKTKKELDINFEVSQTLAECAKFLIEESEIENSINKLLKTVCTYYGAESSYIFEWNENTNILQNDFNFVSDGADFVKIKDISPEHLTMWVNIVKDNSMFFLKDRDSELDYNSFEYDFLKKFNINSMLLVPLIRDGVKTGILGCDNFNRNFQTPELLYTLAGFIMNDIEKKELINELEVLSYTDKLTGLYNRNYYLHLIENHKTLPSKEFGIIFADVNGLKKANDNLGHEYGDILLKWCAKFLQKHLNSSICRIGGDEFICFCENMSEYKFDLCVSTMRSILKKMPHQCMSIGSTWSEIVMDITNQIIETDKMMYLEKQHYYSVLKERNIDPKVEIENLKKAILDLEEDCE